MGKVIVELKEGIIVETWGPHCVIDAGIVEKIDYDGKRLELNLKETRNPKSMDMTKVRIYLDPEDRWTPDYLKEMVGIKIEEEKEE